MNKNDFFQSGAQGAAEGAEVLALPGEGHSLDNADRAEREAYEQKWIAEGFPIPPLAMLEPGMPLHQEALRRKQAAPGPEALQEEKL